MSGKCPESLWEVPRQSLQEVFSGTSLGTQFVLKSIVNAFQEISGRRLGSIWEVSLESLPRYVSGELYCVEINTK